MASQPTPTTAVRQKLEAVIARARESEFVKATSAVAGGVALGQAVVAGLSPVLTRLFDAEEFGLLGVYASLLSILLTVGSLRIEMAIPLPKREREAACLLLSAHGVLVLVSSGVWLVVWAVGDQIAQALNAPLFANYAYWLPVSLLGAGVYQILTYWAIRENGFRVIGQTRFVQSLLMMAVQIGAGLIGVGAGGLILGDVVGRVGGARSLARLVSRRSLLLVRWAGIRAAVSRYREFPLVASWASLLNVAALQVPILLLTGYYGAETAGFFLLAQRIAGAPLGLVGHAISQTFAGESATFIRGGVPEQVYRRTRQIVIRLGLIGLVGFPFALLGPWAFGLVFGDAWVTAGWYFLLLAPMFAIRLGTTAISPVTALAERQRLQAGMDAARALLSIGSIVGAALLGLSAGAAIGCYSAAMCLTSLGSTFVYLRVAWRLGSARQ